MQYWKPSPKEWREKRKQSGIYYRFHECYGDNTNEYRHLHDVIKKLIQERNYSSLLKQHRMVSRGHPTPTKDKCRIGLRSLRGLVED